ATFSLIEAQQLDVQGIARIIGSIELSHPNDETSMHLGRDAGSQTVYPYQKGNVFIGYHSGRLNTDGQANTFLGSETGSSGDGQSNTFIGYRSGKDNKSGINTFVGARAGEHNTSGHTNTFTGFAAGQPNTTGSYNTFFGAFAGAGNSTGTRNTALGYYATVTSPGLINATAIGYEAEVNASNKIRLGDINVSVIEGEVAFSASSDRRLKERILPIPFGLELIHKLNPVIYHRKSNDKADLEMGLIAQDVEYVLKNMNQGDFGMVHHIQDGFYSLRYNDLLAPMIKAIQELSERVIELEKKLENAGIKDHYNSNTDHLH
ncbi:MAG: tail fiber domain-containing protein, partial [Saprospiraceae bacterium]|nr:tail fiber domain-containing protein [Saprospiraceae bacterium]